jgi:hypothetical protein
LLIESFAHLMRVDPGLNPKGVMTFPVSLPANRYTQPEQIVEFYRQVLDKVKGMPEVQSASVTSHLPLSGNARFIFFCPEGRACQGIGKDPTIAQRQVTPGYFQAVQTQLLRGASFLRQRHRRSRSSRHHQSNHRWSVFPGAESHREAHR